MVLACSPSQDVLNQQSQVQLQQVISILAVESGPSQFDVDCKEVVEMAVKKSSYLTCLRKSHHYVVDIESVAFVVSAAWPSHVLSS